MKFSTTFLALSLIAFVVSSPMPAKEDKDSDKSANKNADKSSGKNQAKVAAAGGGGASVLKSQAYNDFSISDGTAGNAAEQANKIFAAIDQSNLAGVSAGDLKIIKNTHDVAEDAEVSAFNQAIEAASGDDAKALKNGKIANKVLKLTATVLQLQITEAQGGKVDAAKLAQEQKKLQKNISIDKAAAGQPMKGVKFDGTN
ncbi:hypothetical protein K3495_g12944 [Podosphaera aphanis]|nr:hypothetical protein K3495_g12944 [Podosphaera aphanis]